MLQQVLGAQVGVRDHPAVAGRRHGRVHDVEQLRRAGQVDQPVGRVGVLDREQPGHLGRVEGVQVVQEAAQLPRGPRWSGPVQQWAAGQQPVGQHTLGLVDERRHRDGQREPGRQRPQQPGLAGDVRPVAQPDHQVTGEDGGVVQAGPEVPQRDAGQPGRVPAQRRHRPFAGARVHPASLAPGAPVRERDRRPSPPGTGACRGAGLPTRRRGRWRPCRRSGSAPPRRHC